MESRYLFFLENFLESYVQTKCIVDWLSQEKRQAECFLYVYGSLLSSNLSYENKTFMMIHDCTYSWVCLRLRLQMSYAKEQKHVWLHRKLNGKSFPLVSPWFDVCLIGKLKRFVRQISIFSVKVLFGLIQWKNIKENYLSSCFYDFLLCLFRKRLDFTFSFIHT